MALTLRRKSLKVWTHEFNGRPVYITPKANFNTPDETFLVIEQFGSKLGVYNTVTKKVEGVPVADITLYDDLNSGSAETFTTVTELSLRLEQLAYPAFFRDGEIVSIAGYIQAGSGVTFTGTGTLLDPIVVTSAGGGASGFENITYSALATKITSSLLVKGQSYRITDFRTVHNIPGTAVDNSGSVEPLIVIALDVNILSNQAYSESNPEDLILYTVTDSTIMSPASGSKGVIYFRHDTINDLSTYYDFREVLFRRWAMHPAPGIYLAYSEYSGINAFVDKKTFGTGNRNIHILGSSYNAVIGDDCYAIEIGANTGIAGAGVTISDDCHGIKIDRDCCQVATVGSGYVGGVYIGPNNKYINIGSRSYNIAIGSGCYAIDLGLQNSDISIPPNTIRRRLDKGFSNFECTKDVSGADTIDLYNTTLSALSGFLYNSAHYCGIVKVTSSNSTENIEVLSALITSVSFQNIRVIPEAGLKLTFADKSTASNASKNLNLNLRDIDIDGDVGEFIEFYKNMLDTFGAQTGDFYIFSTNKFSTGANGSSEIRRVVFSGATITVPSGFAGTVINLNDINTAVTRTIAGTVMTITGGASNGDILIF